MAENTPPASDDPTAQPAPPPERGPLTDLFFLSATEPGQGQFLSPLGPEHYLVQLFAPGTNEPSVLTVVALGQVAAAKWHLYRSVEEWRAAAQRVAAPPAAQPSRPTQRLSGYLRR